MTYIPLTRGFLYLVAVMDWGSRKVLAWRLSNTLESSFCVDALAEALERDGPPEIFNTDQGSQFTSLAFTDGLKNAGIHISMDGKGRWMDNVFIERCGARLNMSRSTWLSTPLSLIRFGGHLSKGEYDGHHGRQQGAADAAELHGRLQDGRGAPGPR